MSVRLRSMGATLLASLLLVTTLPAPASASDSLELARIAVMGTNTLLEGPVYDPGSIDRLCLVSAHSNDSIDPATVEGAVSLSLGEQSVGLTAIAGTTCVRPLEPLQFGQAYTLTVASGTDGLLSTEGKALAADFTTTITTSPAVPVIIADLSAPGGGSVWGALSGAIVDRQTDSIQLRFSRPIKTSAVTKELLTITDSQGQSRPWVVHWNYQEFSIGRPPEELLPKGETYTIRVKGGPDGLQLADGTTLPTDLTYTFTTNTESVRLRKSVYTTQSADRPTQVSAYRFTASAGTLWFSGSPSSGPMAVLITDSAGNLLHSQSATPDAWIDFAIELPEDGSYTLTLAPTALYQFTLTATDLVLDAAMPSLALQDLGALVVRAGRFSVTPVIDRPELTGAVRLTLGSDPLLETALTTTSPLRTTLSPVTIDTTRYADGLYPLVLQGMAREGSSEAATATLLLIDNQSAFPDTATEWSRPWVELLAQAKIVSGRGDGRFHPTANVSRAEFAKMVAATLGYEPAATPTLTFADMPSDWSTEYLQALADEGLMVGEVIGGKRYIHPGRPISRGEAAVILARALGLDKTDISGISAPVTDWAKVPSWAQPSVFALKQIQMLAGRPDGSFGAAASLRRDETAKLLGFFLGL